MDSKKPYKCNECKEPTTPIILENEFAYARLSDPSFAPGHMVVLPKDHAKCLEDLTTNEREAMDDLTMTIRDIFKFRFNYDDIIIWENEGPGRSVEHYHRHVIPGDKINGEWPVKITFVKSLNNKEIDDMTKKLKETQYSD